MPGRVLRALGRFGRQRLIPIVLAAVLAALLSALAAGAASADAWPSGQLGGIATGHQ